MGALLSKSSSNKDTAAQPAAAAPSGESGDKAKPTTTETTEASTLRVSE